MTSLPSRSDGSISALALEIDALDKAEDGRTLAEIRAAEPHYDVPIEKADHHAGGTTVTFDGGLCTVLRGPRVEVGDIVTFWDGGTSPGFNGERHGWALNGEVVEWLTPWERAAKRVKWLADHDRRQRERFEEERAKLDADYGGLSAPMKARIDRFRAERPDFRVTSEAYELFACVEAEKIAAHLRPQVEAGTSPEDAVRAFYDAPWDEQKLVVDDGHSGNTFGGACSMARALLDGEAV